MIQFRPHHFLCALCFQGKGYSLPFIENFTHIMAQLNAASGDQTPIQIVRKTDSICAPCPHNQGAGVCTSQAKINHLDALHAEALDLQHTNMITWGEAKERIHTQLTLKHFDRICAPCNWKASGLCASVLTKAFGNKRK